VARASRSRRACSNSRIPQHESGTIPSMRLAELARVLGATCHGDPELEITGVEGIEEAGPGQLTFVANPKYTPFARTTKAGAVLVTEDFEAISAATLRTANPYLAFARAIDVFHPAPKYPPGIHPTAVVDPSAAPIPKAQFNANTVSVPTDVTPPFGNTVRNIGVSNAYYDLDFGLRKEFPIVREDWCLQFKAEFFNAFNKTDLSPARFPHAKFSLL